MSFVIVDSEIIFHTSRGDAAPRGQFRNLLLNTIVDEQMLTSWAGLLNIDEEKRSPDSPYRLFCNSTILKDILHDNNMEAGRSLEIFKLKMINVLGGDKSLLSLNEFDMVFFPILTDYHYYLVVYDFRTAEIDVIDCRKGNMESFYIMYGAEVEILHNAFMEYLKSAGNNKWERVVNAKPFVLEMKWQTVKNEIDGGIFAMRHMETYMGEVGSKWNIGLGVEGRTQKTKLTKLRKKYALKLLLSEHNVWRERILQAAKCNK